MPIINRFADLMPEITRWRHHLHQRPELQFDVHDTARFVAERLRAFGCDEVVEGIGRTGVVGVIRGRLGSSQRAIGLRADMDALPIMEATGRPWASTVPGRMHACGHDGHTAMLLGAAQYLAETRQFDGAVVLIFQPAEEGGGGGRAMVRDGLMERFGIEAVFGMHNWPGLPIGQFQTRPGPLLASADTIEIRVNGRGGHAALPYQCIDPIVIAAAIVSATQSIVARSVDPIRSAVVSITTIAAGDTDNVIPDTAVMTGTVRTLDAAVRDQIEARLRQIVEATAAAYGGTATLFYRRGYPTTVNHAAETELAVTVAQEIAGAAGVDGAAQPIMGAEDFAYMLEARPGAMVFIGNGSTAGLHHPAYDFTDDVIPHGCSYWVRLTERALPAA
jgi:hippurate hydrolase